MFAGAKKSYVINAMYTSVFTPLRCTDSCSMSIAAGAAAEAKKRCVKSPRELAKTTAGCYFNAEMRLW